MDTFFKLDCKSDFLKLISDLHHLSVDVPDQHHGFNRLPPDHLRRLRNLARFEKITFGSNSSHFYSGVIFGKPIAHSDVIWRIWTDGK